MIFGLDNVQDFFPLLAGAAGTAAALLWLAWSLQMGVVRGTLAALCRVGWLLPLFFGFFPETMTEQLPRAMSLTPLHILIDDSESMKGDGTASAPLAKAEEIAKAAEAECARFGCLPKVTRLSDQNDEVRQGYTPLSTALDAWLYKVGADPWLVVTDGGDRYPSERWIPSLRGLGRPAPGRSEPRGMIVGFPPQGKSNVWIKDHNVAPFSFEDKPIVVDVVLRRHGEGLSTERVQVQVLAGEAPLATVNATFTDKDLETTVSATLPAMPRGQHLLTVRALPLAGETALWDNTAHAPIEVMANTVGVLHLLGSPSWDGRFLRRYLKSEPKYDLISFFILRDPWDSQQVNERELSLIPFPVERLFREELPNFRVVVLQSFTLFQFLLPEYQNNLVKFVQDGGGLLFIGGPRALQPADLSSSPLRAILPFDVDGLPGGSPMDPFPLGMFGDEGGMEEAPQPAKDDGRGPTYDETLAFKVELAQPEAQKRALANVYEDWEALAEPLTSWRTAKGLHRMDRVKFKKDNVTPLLNAKTAKGTIPLAVASYPGKGRAIWIFSDAFWRLGMTVESTTSRQVYNNFMHGAMTWLMRQDLVKPLVAKSFSLTGSRRAGSGWRATLQGPAARYFQPTAEWPVKVCGAAVPEGKLLVSKVSSDEIEISGPLPVNLAGGERCTLEVEGTHAAFGSVKARVTTVFPETFKDGEIDAAPQKLEELAELTGARLSLPTEEKPIADRAEPVLAWLEKTVGRDGVALPSRYKTLRNFFWILDTPWFWLLLLLLPLEVVIRRWDQLFGLRGRAPAPEPQTTSV